jgi:hypothetical protein
MPETFLFQIDGAKDNDAFFEARKPSASYFYGGVDLKIGYWSPDLVEISVDELGDVTVTLIELEQDKIEASKSCRKYLPENSTEIVRKFHEYLGRVIGECRFHPHKDEFARLKTILAKARKNAIITAGALRSSPHYIVKHSLIDQPERIAQTQSVQTTPIAETQKFHSTLKLSLNDANAVSRCILVLDTIVRQRDHSAATFKAWRQSPTQPLKNFLKQNEPAYPLLRTFLLPTRIRGITLNFEIMLSELAKIWSDASNAQFDPERVRNLFNSYFPIALKIKNHERMPVVFEKARKFLADKNNLA